MTAAGAAVALAAAFAVADAAAPAGARPSGVRRALRAGPAAALAVALRLASAPPLPATALLAFAVADALALDGRDPGVGGWTAGLLAQLFLAAAVWELASPGLLVCEPWRGGATLAVLGFGWAALRRRAGPRGELDALRPAPILLLAAAAAGAGAEPSAAVAVPFVAAVVFWAAVASLRLARAAPAGLGRGDRALRSSAAFALALPLLTSLRVTGL